MMFIHSLKYIKKLSTPTFEEGVGLESLVFNFGFLDKYKEVTPMCCITLLSQEMKLLDLQGGIKHRKTKALF